MYSFTSDVIPIKYAGQLHSDEKKNELVITNYIPKKDKLVYLKNRRCNERAYRQKKT